MRNLWMMMIVVTTVILLIFFYAYIYYPSVEVPILIEEVNEDAPGHYQEPSKFEDSLSIKKTSPSGLDDVVSYTFNRNQPEVMQRFFLDYSGMNDMDALELSLKNQDYIFILRALWSEKDISKRLKWLSEKEDQNHTILIFELALDLFKNDPTLENLQRALFLLELGKYRADLDSICINDPSVRSASKSLYVNYATAIGNIAAQKPNLIEALRLNSKDLLSKNILEELLVALDKIENNLDELPPPNWISNYSLKKLFDDDDIAEPVKICKEKQIQLIQVFKKQIEAQIKTLK